MNEGGKNILVVEDDQHIAKIYETKFSKEGYNTILAVNGEDAIQKATAQKPDLIMLDLMVPKKDGFVVLEEIKKVPNLASVPVIVISNLGQASDKDRALALGANEYMIKVEYSMQEVVDMAKKYL